MPGWALDLGTTNSGIALWDDATDQPRLVEPVSYTHLTLPTIYSV